MAGDGGRGDVGEAGAGVEAVGDGEGRGVGEGEGGYGGGRGDELSVIMFIALEASAPRSISGESASPSGEMDRRADCPRLLAMMAALLLARVAVMAALTCFIGRGLALRVRARSRGKGVSRFESLKACRRC